MTKLTEADQRLIHAYVTDGGCWHIWGNGPKIKGSPYGPTIKCALCGITPYRMFIKPNPDYSTRQHFPDLTDKLFGDEGMWEKFYISLYEDDDIFPLPKDRTYDHEFAAWLFSDYARFVTLFVEFLRLPETVREFGYKECSCKSMGWDIAKCHQCSGSGQILRPWAKLVEEGK